MYLGRAKISPMDTASASTAPSNLTLGQQKVLHAVVEHIRSRGLQQDEHLTESNLAQITGTSRSPVRAVLEHLQRLAVVRYDKNRGYFLNMPASALPTGIGEVIQSRDDQVYLALASARFEGRLPAAATETDLSRLLDVTRSDVHKALRRAEHEGWAEKSAGYGWEFLPTVDSLDTYDDLYAVRVALEPAGVLNPKFKPNRAQLSELRDEQRRIAEADPQTLSPVYLFEANSRFHSTIASWSQNHVAIQILQRLDKARRLTEYRQATRPLPRDALANEHCGILDAIESGDTLTAASLLRIHLDGARRQKVTKGVFPSAT